MSFFFSGPPGLFRIPSYGDGKGTSSGKPSHKNTFQADFCIAAANILQPQTNHMEEPTSRGRDSNKREYKAIRQRVWIKGEVENWVQWFNLSDIAMKTSAETEGRVWDLDQGKGKQKVNNLHNVGTGGT